MYNTVGQLVEKYENFVQERFKLMGSFDNSLLHAAVGISGEAGEFLDAVKKTWAYGKPFDFNHGIEELGDLFFYMFSALQVMNVSFEQVILANMEKLSKRYPTGYTDAAAIARADKQKTCFHPVRKERIIADKAQKEIYCADCEFIICTFHIQLDKPAGK